MSGYVESGYWINGYAEGDGYDFENPSPDRAIAIVAEDRRLTIVAENRAMEIPE